LQKKIEAKQAFENYLKDLSELKNTKQKNELYNIEHIDDEMNWTKKMIFKSEHL
jgi:hypothetical protein